MGIALLILAAIAALSISSSVMPAAISAAAAWEGT